jgi:hypothetical protein
MNEEYGNRGDDGQGNHLLPPYYFTELPQCKFYKQGLTEANKGWLEAIVALIRNARGKILVAVVVVLALCKIACEFLEKGSNNLNYKSITGTLLLALMILTIGLVSLRRVEDTDVGQKEKRKKDKVESAKSGAGRISPGQNRRPSTRDGGPNLDGGGK